MTLTFGTLIRQVLASITQPREVARWVMAFQMNRTARWQALLLVVILSIVLNHLSLLLFLGPDGGALIGAGMPPEVTALVERLLNPWVGTIIQMSILVIGVFAVYWIGRLMGGRGGFGNAILLVAWLQFCLVCVKVVQIAVMLLLPILGSFVNIAGVVLFFWLLTNFIAELHGFRSLPAIFMMIIVSILAMLFGFSLVMAIIGITLPGVSANV